MIKYFKRIIEGLSIGGQEGLAKSLNNAFDILENLEGAPLSGIKVNREGNIWRIGYDGSQSGNNTIVGIKPWECRVSGSNILVRVGRVYEYGVGPLEGVGLGNSQITFEEAASIDSVSPGDDFTLTPSTDDYISIVVDSSDGKSTAPDYQIILESAFSWMPVVKRLAKVIYVDGSPTIEVIHTGDVSYTRERTHAFKIAKNLNDGNLVMYVPLEAICVNGYYFTASGLTASSLTDWYILPANTNPMSLFILMAGDNGSNFQFGKPLSVEFGQTPPSNAGEIITIDIYKDGAASGKINFVSSAINIEVTRPDSNYVGNASKWKSLNVAGATSTKFSDDTDRTLEVNGFRLVPAPDEDPFAEDPDRTQHIAVRETNSTGDGADLRWYNLRTLISTMKTAVSDYVLENLPPFPMDFSGWLAWYEGLDPEDQIFWIKGGDEEDNYGTAIGNTGKSIVIGLDSQTLKTAGELSAWNCEADFLPADDDLYSLGSSTLYWLEGYISDLYTDIINAKDSTFITFQHNVRGSNTSLGTSAADGFFSLHLADGGSVNVNDVKVVGNRQAAVADATSTSDVVAQLNALLSALRTHGLIAT